MFPYMNAPGQAYPMMMVPVVPVLMNPVFHCGVRFKMEGGSLTMKITPSPGMDMDTFREQCEQMLRMSSGGNPMTFHAGNQPMIAASLGIRNDFRNSQTDRGYIETIDENIYYI